VAAGVPRLVLLMTSHRSAPGLLSWPAWQLLTSAEVHAGVDAGPHEPYLAAAGVDVERGVDAAGLLARAARTTVVRLLGADGEPDLARALGGLAAREAEAGRRPPEIEIVHGSYDLPGARLLDLVAVMDRLRSPGGCPWDAEQTHESLLQYLLEEAYETVEAVEAGDRAHLREELGDLLLQVMFHARIAEEHPDDPFSVDDVAGGIVDKLIHRHPHVFGDVSAETAEIVEANWEALKAAEKGRTSATDGVPLAQPALALAAKLMSRAEKAGIEVPVAAVDAGGADVGDLLLGVVALARRQKVDPEAALRSAARRYAEAVREAERPAAASPGPPGASA
jgi:XTP/dITP diphosphohydrolase